MAFGPVMKLTVGAMNIELAPFNREEVVALVPGMQKASVIKFLNGYQAQTLESEQEWYDKQLADKNGYLWGIWVCEDGSRKLIGTTSLMDIKRYHVHQATSGSVITDKEYWGRGIASATHKARTWFAFKHLGLTRIMSAVQYGNIASTKALEKSGYTLVYVERNVTHVDGELRHQECLECLNPIDWAWRLWWGDDRPTRKSIEARAKTKEIMQWAEENVELL